MCFSAQASFSSAAVLMAAGSAATMMNRDKSQRMWAAIPFLFGMQQASEGIVWMTMGQNTSELHRLAVTSFLSFAMVIWPSWVPWSVYFFEPDERRKRILKYLGSIGILVSVVVAWYLLGNRPTAYIVGHSVGYAIPNLNRDMPPNIDFVAYISSTLFPFFVSTRREVQLTGAMILVGLVAAKIINAEASASVWCFFSALVSAYIAVSIVSMQRHRLS